MDGEGEYGSQKRLSRQRCSMPHILAIVSLLTAIMIVGLVVYHEIRISKLEEDQLLLKRFITTLSSKLMQPRDLENVHILKKRDGGTEQNAEELLRRLTLHDITALRGLPGRDGRDGRDGKDCDMLGLEKIIVMISNHSHDTSSTNRAAFDQDGFLQRFNETIGFALLRGLQAANRKLIDLKEELADVETHSHSETTNRGSSSSSSVIGGSTYVRWGRTTCSNTSEMIYTGFAAGQHYSHTGGASNYQCLPLRPEYSTYLNGDQGNYIYGAEYQTNSDIFPQRMQDQNVPCARCYTPSRSATMMIPAKKTCPDSWTKEYDGYLMAGHYSHKRAYAYECVDKEPEAIAGFHGNTDGALFYFTQGHCPSTGHCPPYIEGAELTCVVCTK